MGKKGEVLEEKIPTGAEKPESPTEGEAPSEST
jgi:hypothetical protein